MSHTEPAFPRATCHDDPAKLVQPRRRVNAGRAAFELESRSGYTARPGIASRRSRDGVKQWAVSSAVEHYLDMVGVTGSIPVLPTNPTLRYPQFSAGTPVRRIALQFWVCVSLACAASAFANVGSTSSSVTTVDPNSPSSNVQQQSSGFVAANQQAQNAAAGGIALPGAAGAAQAGQTATGNADAKGTQSGQTGEHAATAEQHAAPAAPPPPPPTYESKMRPVNVATVPAPAPPQPAASAPPVQSPVRAPAKPAGPAIKPTVAAPAMARNHAPPPEKKQDEPVPAVPADPGGGRGAAPDGYTFWLGLLVAGALLALAAVTYMRIQHGETPR